MESRSLRGRAIAWVRGLPSRHGRWTLALLAAIVLLALGLRVAQAMDPVEAPGPDSEAYSAIASHLYKTGEYGTPGMENESDWSPGAVLFYTGVYIATDGVREQAAHLAVAFLGALLVLATYALARRLARAASVPQSPAGLLAALAAAIYPAFIYDAGRLMSEPFAELGLTLLVLSFLWATDQSGSPWPFLLPGALLGLTSLFRPEYLPFSLLFALLIAVWSVTRATNSSGSSPRRAGDAGEGPSRGATAPQAGRISGGRTRENTGSDLPRNRVSTPASRFSARALRRSLLPALALLLGFALITAPWTIRNAIALDRFVPISTGGGKALFIGTYLPGDGDHFRTKRALYYEQNPGSELAPDQVDLLPMQPILDRVAERRPELERDAALAAEGRENLNRYLSERPLELAGMTGRKVWRMWRSGSGPAMDGVAPAILHASLCLLGLTGLVVLALRRRREAVVIGLLVVGITAVGALLLASPRRNLILMPLVFSLAGMASAWLLATVRDRGRRASTV